MDLYKRVLRQISSASEISPEIQAALKLTKQLEDMDCENRPWKQPFTPIYPVSLQPLSREEAVEDIGDQMREGDAQTPAGTTQETPPVEEKPLVSRERNSLLNTIAALLELVQNHRPGRDSEAAVIRELVENYSDKEGISKSTLEKRFAQAKRMLNHPN